MILGLSAYARQLSADRASFSALLDCPLLVWGAPSHADEAQLFSTLTGPSLTRPSAAEPLVFLLRKSDSKSNAFAIGVTVGRTENNDVVLDDNSVSRFHAYFLHDVKGGGWRLVDAESKNGTWLNAVRLSPNQAEKVEDNAQVRFGDIQATFMQPETFMAYLEQPRGGSGQGSNR